MSDFLRRTEERVVRVLVTLFVALTWTLVMPWFGLILLLAHFGAQGED